MIKTAEGAKTNVGHQVSCCFLVSTRSSQTALFLKYMCQCVCCFKVGFGIVGNDALAAHLHDGSGAGHQEQCDVQKDIRTAPKPLLPGTDVSFHVQSFLDLAHLLH